MKTMNMKMETVLGTLLIFLSLVHAAPDDIYLQDGGYGGILVAIDDNVRYSPHFLDNLRSVFVEASRALYKATFYERRTSGKPDDGLTSGKHFANITVLLPKSWPFQQQCRRPIAETYGAASFRVIVDSAQWGGLLSTHFLSSECREPAAYTTIPHSFINDTLAARAIYGQDLGKGLLHEWAQLRWGLREESNNKNGGDTCMIDPLRPDEYNWMPIRCSQYVDGETLPDPNNSSKCIFVPADDASNNAEGSIMYFRLPFYQRMVTFCDEVYPLPDGTLNSPPGTIRHDPIVDHPHNLVCDRKSAWQLLREHPDFDPENAAPFDDDFDFDAALEMQCVQTAATVRIVLVMDASNSMKGDRLTKMQGDVALFLQSLPFGETEVAMVEFDEFSRVLKPLMPLDSNETLAELLAAIPDDTEYGTCIGCGIDTALQVLDEGNGTAAGGLLAVFTDGAETNHYPKLADITPVVLEKQAIVHGLLMAGVADDHDLIKLSTQSGGTFCLFEVTGNENIDFYDCLMAIVDSIGDFAPIEVQTEDVTVPAGGSVQGGVDVDSSFAPSLRFVLSWIQDTFSHSSQHDDSGQAKHRRRRRQGQSGCGQFELQITAPGDHVIGPGHPRYSKQDDYKLIIIDAAGFEAGEWAYEVQNPHSVPCAGRLRVEAFPDRSSPDDTKQPILISAAPNKLQVNVTRDGKPLDNIVTLYATLTQGLAPVVNAEVNATIERSGFSHTVQLYDNGIGADNSREDGVYSGYFYQYEASGAYSVRAYALGIAGHTSILRETRELRRDAAGDSYQVVRTQTREHTGAFQRAAIAGAFEVQMNGVSDMGSLVPPARINDLRRGKVVADDWGEDAVELMWTATGESMNDGRASRYDLRVCVDVTQALDSCLALNDTMLALNGTLSSPLPAGRPESLLVSLWALDDAAPAGNGSAGALYAVIRAVDAYGNVGAGSNVARLQSPVIAEPPEIPDVPEDPPVLAIVLGSLACVALIGGVLAGVLVYVKKQKKVHPEVYITDLD